MSFQRDFIPILMKHPERQLVTSPTFSLQIKWRLTIEAASGMITASSGRLLQWIFQVRIPAPGELIYSEEPFLDTIVFEVVYKNASKMSG